MVIPDTIITTSEKALRDFFQRYKGQIIVKPIQTQVINTGGDSLVFGSRKLSDTELGSACADTACFAQATIEIAAEIRVVMFGRECRAFKMTRSQKVEDLKQLELKDIEHEVFQLGTTEKMQICTLMDYYDLEFAACDFILTPKDELVFLELNPNGQWLWLQYMTGFNLIDPFIDFLTT
jgi:glutathione synthase/RimK-type ligase-like ATP-grasp enzyme